MNFWENLPKPFSVLAPMEDVTDTVFRQIVLIAGRPDVFFTEFTSVDGICSKGFEKVSLRLKYTDVERPLVAQIWGNKPELFLQTAKLLAEMKFDGIDINMGCPDRAVLKQGCGAALSNVEYRSLVAEIVAATKEGGGGLPVSVKTRLGHRKQEEGWIDFLLDQELAALTIHARIAKDMSLVPARWEEISEVVKRLGDRKTKIVGNGDIKSMDDPRIVASGVDGVMIGRGIFENPFVFTGGLPEKEKNLRLLVDHLNLWEKTWGAQKNYAVMKKFFKMYVRDFDGAGELRALLMETVSVEMALGVLKSRLG